jgi:elongation factor P hydroxylase
MNITRKLEYVCTEGGVKFVVVTWNLAGKTEGDYENFSNQCQAETREHLFKYLGNFMDRLRKTTKRPVIVTGISHTIQFSHRSKAGILKKSPVY